jgi:hypothetical protein
VSLDRVLSMQMAPAFMHSLNSTHLFCVGVKWVGTGVLVGVWMCGWVFTMEQFGLSD